MLTRDPDGVCLTCHGPSAGASTDVVDGIGYEAGGTRNGNRSTAPGALRGGGFDFALIGTGIATKDTYLCGSTLRSRNQRIPVLAVGRVTTSSHRVTGTATGNAATGSGAGGAVALHCGSCHDPHGNGNGNYRILRPIPANAGTSTAAVAVRIPDSSVKVYTTTNYWLSGDAGVPPVVNGVRQGTEVTDGFTSSITPWCTTCHSSRRTGPESKMNVGTNCITCHVAHGSNASMSEASARERTKGATAVQVNMSDGLAAPGKSSVLLRVNNGVACLMCHNA